MEETTTNIEIKKTKGFWTSINISKILTALTIIGLLYGWFNSVRTAAAEKQKEKEQDAIEKHDDHQYDDSLRYVVGLLQHRLDEIQGQRIERIQKQDEKDRLNDLSHYEFGLRISRLEQWEKDFTEFYINKHKN